MPMIEKIIHTAKQVVKATVEIQSARFWAPLVIKVPDIVFLALILARFFALKDACRRTPRAPYPQALRSSKGRLLDRNQ